MDETEGLMAALTAILEMLTVRTVIAENANTATVGRGQLASQIKALREVRAVEARQAMEAAAALVEQYVPAVAAAMGR